VHRKDESAEAAWAQINVTGDKQTPYETGGLFTQFGPPQIMFHYFKRNFRSV